MRSRHREHIGSSSIINWYSISLLTMSLSTRFSVSLCALKLVAAQTLRLFTKIMEFFLWEKWVNARVVICPYVCVTTLVYVCARSLRENARCMQWHCTHNYRNVILCRDAHAHSWTVKRRRNIHHTTFSRSRHKMYIQNISLRFGTKGSCSRSKRCCCCPLTFVCVCASVCSSFHLNLSLSLSLSFASWLLAFGAVCAI